MRLHVFSFIFYALLFIRSEGRQWPADVHKTHGYATEVDLLSSWTPPLSTRGRYIVDASGERFRLVAGSWHGASGTWTGKGDVNDPSTHHAEEQSFQTPLCLDRVPIDELVQDFIELGINTIRLPFSNEMIHTSSPPPDAALRANPQLRGMTPLQIFDACIEALTKRGLAVILNNHTVKSIWCCGADTNARWNGAQTDEQWADDWVYMMRRYKRNSRVVGAELYNEVRRDLLVDPTWGSGTYTDWWRASQQAGARILREANPDVLIIVEGINFVGIPTRYTTHWRPELQPVGQISHALPVLDKLVYSSHYYAYTGRNATGSGTVTEQDPLYRDLTADELDTVMRQLAFFVATDTHKHYSAPVWISEFGSAGRGDFLEKNRRWWNKFTDLLIKYDIDFAIWPLVGWQQYGQGDGWAMHMYDARGQRLSVLDPGDWRLPGLRKIVNTSDDAVRTGKVRAPDATYVQLYTQQGSVQQSNTLANDVSLSQPGAVQASCPDGLRLAGLSFEERPAGLCTDAVFGRLFWNTTAGEATYDIITQMGQDPTHWASGLKQFTCSTNHHIIGYSYDDDATRSIVCAKNAGFVNARSKRRTVKFGQSSQLADDRGQWYPIDGLAGTCADDEVMVGIAFTRYSPELNKPQALLCERFER